MSWFARPNDERGVSDVVVEVANTFRRASYSLPETDSFVELKQHLIRADDVLARFFRSNTNASAFLAGVGFLELLSPRRFRQLWTEQRVSAENPIFLLPDAYAPLKRRNMEPQAFRLEHGQSVLTIFEPASAERGFDEQFVRTVLQIARARMQRDGTPLAYRVSLLPHPSVLVLRQGNDSSAVVSDLQDYVEGSTPSAPVHVVVDRLRTSEAMQQHAASRVGDNAVVDHIQRHHHRQHHGNDNDDDDCGNDDDLCWYNSSTMGYVVAGVIAAFVLFLVVVVLLLKR